MLLETGCENAPSKLQGRARHSAKIRLSAQRLLGAHVCFDKAPEQTHSVLFALGDCVRRQMAGLLQPHLRLTDIAPKILKSQIGDFEAIDDIQIGSTSNQSPQ